MSLSLLRSLSINKRFDFLVFLKMGCGASTSANAAVEPISNNESRPGTKISHHTSTNHHTSYNPTATKTIGTNENTNATIYGNNNTVLNGKARYQNGPVFFSTQNGTQRTTSQTDNLPPPKQISPSAADDPHWQELWLAHKDILLDPSDVHATLQDLMANATNRLSDAEILFLQRRIRSIVRQSHLQTGQQSSNHGGKNRKKTRRTSGSDKHSAYSSIMQELQETHTIAKDYHLLTAHVLRKILPQPPFPMAKSNLESFLAFHFAQTTTGSRVSVPIHSDNTVGGVGNDSGVPPSATVKNSVSTISTVQTIDTTYLLALFCNDVLWDKVAEIAVESAKANDLDMDVNHIVQDSKVNNSTSTTLQYNQSNLPQLPVPSKPTCEQRPERPLGMGMHALTFILGLALRKYISRLDFIPFFVAVCDNITKGIEFGS